MDTSSLTFKAFKNTLYNIIGYIWPIAFTLIVTPMIVFGLGIKEYGIYLFVNTVVSLFGLLDLGLGTAVAKHLSFYSGKNDTVAIRKLTHSANSLFLIVAVVGFSASCIAAFAGGKLLPSQFSAYSQYSMLFLIGGGIFFLNTFVSTATASIVAAQRFDIYNKINVISVTLMSLGTLAAVKLSGSLNAIFLTQLASTFVICSITFYYGSKMFAAGRFNLGWDAKEIIHLYKFGLVIFVNNVGTSTLVSLDRFIIPLFVGPTNLTYYSMPGNVTARIPGMSNTLSATFFPTVSQFSGSEDMERIRTLYIRSFRLITTVAGALTITSMAFAHEILLYWLNADFSTNSANILVILALTNFVLALFNPLSNFLIGLGKVKFIALSSLGMSILDLGLLFILLPRYGITGAAIAYLISVLPVVYLFYYVEKHYLGLTGRRDHYIKTILGTVFVGCIVWFIDRGLGHFVNSLPTLLITGAVSGILYILIYKILGFFHKEDWHDIERFYNVGLRKLRLIK